VGSCGASAIPLRGRRVGGRKEVNLAREGGVKRNRSLLLGHREIEQRGSSVGGWTTLRALLDR